MDETEATKREQEILDTTEMLRDGIANLIESQAESTSLSGKGLCSAVSGALTGALAVHILTICELYKGSESMDRLILTHAALLKAQCDVLGRVVKAPAPQQTPLH